MSYNLKKVVLQQGENWGPQTHCLPIREYNHLGASLRVLESTAHRVQPSQLLCLHQRWTGQHTVSSQCHQ